METTARNRSLVPAGMLLYGLGILILFGGCTTNSAPKRWLPTPEQTQYQGYGAWIEVETTNGASRSKAYGELIAADSQTVHILVDSQFRSLPVGTIIEGRIFVHSSNWAGMAAWTMVGAVSTLSNGAFLVFTLPLWLIIGPLASGSQSRRPLHTYPKESWDRLAVFARFPAGLPPAVRSDPGILRPKQ